MLSLGIGLAALLHRVFSDLDIAALDRLLEVLLLREQRLLLTVELLLPGLALFIDVACALLQRFQLAVCREEFRFDLVLGALYLSVGCHAFDDSFHFLDALLQDALLAEMLSLLAEKLRKAIAGFLARAVLVGNALLDGRDEQAVDEHIVRMAVLKKGLDAALGLVDGGDFVPLCRDDAEVFLNIVAVALQGVVFRKEMSRHVLLGDAAEIRRHFLFGRWARVTVILADERELLDGVRILSRVFAGKFLRCEHIFAVAEKRDGGEGIAARPVLENPLDGDVSGRVAELQRLLDFAVGHGFARQDGLNERLDKNGFASTILQEQDTVESVETERGIDVALLAIVIHDIREADPADGWHGLILLCGRGDGFFCGMVERV